jgi:predicted MFS family arabinose efflux permease
MPDIKGFAMGAVTAAYAVGSILFAKLIAWRIETVSVPVALFTVALILIGCGILAALLLRVAGASYAVAGDAADKGSSGQPALERRKIVQFWIAYMTSVFAGLMAIGHAAGIAFTRHASLELATFAAITIGIGSALGGFLAGWLVDRWPLSRFLVGLPLLSAFALLAIGVSDDAPTTVALLSLVGFAYGSIIAIYPVAISNHFQQRGPEAYGLVFIAWGFAGLVAPWSAGFIYDQRAGYELALVIAAVVALLSAFSALIFRLGKTA